MPDETPRHAAHVHHEPPTDVEAVQITHDPATDESTLQAQHVPTDVPVQAGGPEVSAPQVLDSPAPDVKPEPTGAGTIGSAQSVDPKDYVTHEEAGRETEQLATEPGDPDAEKSADVAEEKKPAQKAEKVEVKADDKKSGKKK